MSTHGGGWLVPVRRDLDGSWLILCPALDDAAEIGHGVDGWALWCSSCRAIVGGVVEGTQGLLDLDGLPDALADALLDREHDLGQAHAAEMRARTAVGAAV